jgi:hypothetical protein
LEVVPDIVAAFVVFAGAREVGAAPVGALTNRSSPWTPGEVTACITITAQTRKMAVVHSTMVLWGEPNFHIDKII